MGGLFHDYFNNFLFFESHIHIFINLLKIPLKIPHAEIFFIFSDAENQKYAYIRSINMIPPQKEKWL